MFFCVDKFLSSFQFVLPDFSHRQTRFSVVSMWPVSFLYLFFCSCYVDLMETKTTSVFTTAQSWKGGRGQQIASFLLSSFSCPRCNTSKDNLYDLLPISPKYQNTNIQIFQISKYPNIRKLQISKYPYTQIPNLHNFVHRPWVWPVSGLVPSCSSSS